MGYFAVDDVLLSHFRAKVAGPAGIGLWTMGGLYCNTQLTDGHIPRLVAENLLPNAKPAVKKLLESGLWENCAEHEQCYVMRAYHADSSGGQRQPTRAEVERRRAVAREKKRQQRRGPAGQYAPPDDPVPPRPDGVPQGHNRDTADVSPSNSTPYSTPLHTPEVSDETSSAAQAPQGAGKPKTTRGTRIPDAFVVTAEMKTWAGSEAPGVDLSAETRKFVDYWRAASGQNAVKRDWVATWRNWIRTAAERNPQPAVRKPFVPIPWDPEADSEARRAGGRDAQGFPIAPLRKFGS